MKKSTMKKSKKKRRTMKKAIITILLLMLGTSTAFLTYLHFFASGERDLSGEWTADIDVTEQAAVTALDWLQDIEAVSVSLEDMESYMHDLTIQVNLTMEQTTRSEGTFSCHVLTDSYDACNQAAYEAFAEAFRELLGERLLMAGYADAVGPEEIETLVAGAFGMSTESYLMSYGPALLPSLETLQARYDGSGTYEAADGILIRQFDAGGAGETKEESYIRKDTSLVLTGEAGAAASADRFFSPYPMVYTLKEAGNGQDM